MVVKRVSDLDIRRRGFITAISGNYDDSFVDDDLCTYTFDMQLYLYLLNEGYDRVCFYSRAMGYGWYSFDKDSLSHPTCNDSEEEVEEDDDGYLNNVLSNKGVDKKTGKAINKDSKERKDSYNKRSLGRPYYCITEYKDSTLIEKVQDILRDTSKKSVVYFTSPEFSISEVQGFVSGIAQIMSEVAASQSENKLLLKYNSNGVFNAPFFAELLGSETNVFHVGLPDEKECENWLNAKRINKKIDTKQIFTFPHTKLVNQLFYQHITLAEMDKQLNKDKEVYISTLHVEDFSEDLMRQSLSKIHGQQDNLDIIVKKVSTWILRPDEGKVPLVFMFAGTSGTGKTYTAETISETLKSYGYLFVKLPMNEYKSEGDVWKLLGSAAGYAGSESDTPLIAARRKTGRLVILFDEMEKAHESIFETIMTLMEKGEITNGKGEMFDFRQSIIIFTTNLAMSQLIERKLELKRSGEKIDSFFFQKSIKDILKQNGVKPEICGRINDVFVYNTLGKEDVARIAIEEIRNLGIMYSLRVNNIPRRLLQEIALTVADNNEGSRPIKRIVCDVLESVIQGKTKCEVVSKNKKKNIHSLPMVDITEKMEIKESEKDHLLSADDILQQYDDLTKESKVVAFDKNKLMRYLSTVKGQQDNIGVIIDAINIWIRKRKKTKPLVLMFAGTSGTGKTFTAQNIQRSLAEDGYKFVRLNMNEYHSEADAWKLLGSATGHVGSEIDAPLFAARKMSDKLVILFDEIEKAHPSLFTTIMSLMDEGVLANGRGVSYDFRQSVIIFTTNQAMDRLLETKKTLVAAGVDITSNEFQDATKKILKDSQIPNEICGRINWLLVYNALGSSDVVQIALDQIRAKGKEYDMNIGKVSSNYLEQIAEQCSGSNEGARPIKREIDKTIEPIFQSAYESGYFSLEKVYDITDDMQLVESITALIH